MTLLDEWRAQEAARNRTRYPFAAPDAERCDAVIRNKYEPPGFKGESVWHLFRCGKRAGHETRHECADETFALKWMEPTSTARRDPAHPEEGPQQ